MKKICEFLNCKEEGIYPAPRSRKDITNYKYYCIEHIRDFNKSWNYFEGLTEEEFENEIRKSLHTFLFSCIFIFIYRNRHEKIQLNG